MTELNSESTPEVLSLCFKRLLYSTFVTLDFKYNEDVPVEASQVMDEKEQYALLRKYIVENAVKVIHMGVVAFYVNKTNTKYTPYPYTAYVCHPDVYKKVVAYPKNKFVELVRRNFNLFGPIASGIQYLTKAEVERLRLELHSYTTLAPARRDAAFDQEGSFLKKYLNNKKISEMIIQQCSVVSKWLTTAKVGEFLILENTDYQDVMPFFLLRREILGLYRSVWVGTDNKKMRVEYADCMRRGKAETEDMKTLRQENYVVDSFTLFNRIVGELTKLRKPIVCHDLMFALMVAHNQINEPLPDTYHEFLTALKFHGQPYDTRLLGLSMRRAWYRRVEGPESLDLGYLYGYLKNGPGLMPTSEAIPVWRPEPTQEPAMVEDIRYKELYSGWEYAYQTGYLYVKLKYYLDERGIDVPTLFDKSLYLLEYPETPETPPVSVPGAMDEEAEMELALMERESLSSDEDLDTPELPDPDLSPKKVDRTPKKVACVVAKKPDVSRLKLVPAAPPEHRHYFLIAILFGTSAVGCLIGFKLLPKILQ